MSLKNWAQRLSVTFLIILMPSLVHAEGYLCIAEKSSGFSYNKITKEWEHTQFKVDGKYLIRKPTKDDFRSANTKWIIMEFGNQTPSAWCKDGINSDGFLYCESFITEYKLNFQTMRYLKVYAIGYYNSGRTKHPDSKSDTPYIEIGTCTKM